MTSRRTGTKLLFLAALACPRAALGSAATEYPDNGVAQFSRGGAWLATATDPIAGYYNPAALALQPTALGAGLTLAFQRICLRRRGPSDRDASYSAVGEPYPEVCNENAGRPNPFINFGVAFRASERLGIGLSVLPPSSFGKTEWPASVAVTDAGGQSRRIPAPQRYLSLGADGTVYFPRWQRAMRSEKICESAPASSPVLQQSSSTSPRSAAPTRRRPAPVTTPAAIGDNTSKRATCSSRESSPVSTIPLHRKSISPPGTASATRSARAEISTCGRRCMALLRPAQSCPSVPAPRLQAARCTPEHGTSSAPIR